jgi:Ca-activated chloride channel family protein
MRVGLLSVIVAAAAASAACHRENLVDPSVAQVEPLRAGVAVTHGGSESVTHARRLTTGDAVRTDANGRASLALDAGARYDLDHATTVHVTSARSATLDEGRLWIAAPAQAARADETLLSAASLTLHLRGSRASIERHGPNATVTVLGGEVAYEGEHQRGAIRAGESMRLTNGAITVAHDDVFDDWTGGLADEAGAGSGEAAGLGAVAARRPDETGSPRWPMVMQRLDAHVVVRGDLAITTIDQTFFNPSATTVEGLYTFTAPAGAVLESFAVDRRGRTIEGIPRERQQAAAQYQAQVYEGSTHDPALLEWDAPGQYHARLYPIPAGANRRVRVRYTQWLAPDAHGHRVYRLPLASLETRIGELRADIDLDDADVNTVRTVAGARLDDHHVYISQSDVLPRADLVVEMHGAAPAAASAVTARSSGDDRTNLLRVAIPAPVEAAQEMRDEGVDLVVLVDHSAGTDAVARRLEQAFVEALVRQLDARDHVLVLAGDVATRPLGSPAAELQSATPDVRRALIDALSHDDFGGATDLSAMIAAAHRALRPDRNGAIVYVGDGEATVGERDLAALRQMISRLSPRPRFYAVGVGEEPRLDLLSGLAAPSGLAVRVARRADVARTALDLVAHASRPLVRNVRVELGPDVQNVYPAEPIDVPAGEPMVVTGRVVGNVPRSVTVHGMWNGREITRTITLDPQTIDDDGDLRARWATMRLEHLLARGESRPVIVELGMRFHLVTPFTSFYVPSEDEVVSMEEREREARSRGERVASLNDLSVFDLLPLVGCSRRASSPEPMPTAAATPAAQSTADNQQEGGRGTRHAGPEGRMGSRDAPATSARYATSGNEQSQSHLARQAERNSVAQRGIFAALGAPGGGEAGNAQGVTSPFGGVTADGTENAPVAAAAPPPPDEIDGTLDESVRRAAAADRGLGTIGHGSRAGSGSGYEIGAGRNMRERAARSPLVRAAPPSVAGLLSPEVIRRVVSRNLAQVAHCHEQGLAANPNSQGRVVVRFVIGGDGSVMGSNVAESSIPVASEASCIANAVRRWQFPSPEGGGLVTVNYPFDLVAPEGWTPPPNANGAASVAAHAPAPAPIVTASRCSDAAVASLDERIALWRERLAGHAAPSEVAEIYRTAKQSCELPAQADRAALLRLMLGAVGALDGQIALYRALDHDGAARSWLRANILRMLARTGELAQAESLGLGRLNPSEMAAALANATTLEARLALLRELSRRYPDDNDLAMRLLDTAIDARAADDVRAVARRLRSDAQSDARVRTAVGEALLSIGDEAEARRAFSEIVEFAPDDPLARRRLGDIALSHRWADEAYRQFQVLAEVEHDAPDVLLREAMAARMAGRLDEAIRLAERVAQMSSGGGAGASIPDTAAAWIGLELALAASAPGAASDRVEALRARWRRSAAARGAGAMRVVLRWSHPDDGAELWLTLPGEVARRSDSLAGAVFFESTAFADVPQGLQLEVRRPEGTRARGEAELIVLWNEGSAAERVVRMPITLDADHAVQRFGVAASDVAPIPVPATPGPVAMAERTLGGAR